MTARERAEEIVQAWIEGGDIGMVEPLASALEAYGDQKLEEAAVKLDKTLKLARIEAARIVRSLKSKKGEA